MNSMLTHKGGDPQWGVRSKTCGRKRSPGGIPGQGTTGDKEGFHILPSRFREVNGYAYRGDEHCEDGNVISENEGVLHILVF